jgi:hypothetical protein
MDLRVHCCAALSFSSTIVANDTYILRSKPPKISTSIWSTLWFYLKCSFFTVLVLAAVYLTFCTYMCLKRRKETNYRLAVRRKYGIPDDDTRPFVVAYGAINVKRREPALIKYVEECIQRPIDGGSVAVPPLERMSTISVASCMYIDQSIFPIGL